MIGIGYRRRIGLRYVADVIAQALWSLKDNRLRTILSVLGVTVGIAAVMVVGTISDGGRAVVFSELQTFGLNSVWVFRDRRIKDPHQVEREGTGIVTEDYRILQGECCPAVRRITPVVMAGAKAPLIRQGGRYSDAGIHGVGEHYLVINNDTLNSGRFLTEEDVLRRRRVAIIGTEVREDLFGNHQDPLGQEFRIGRHKFTVIGVLNAKSRDFLASIGSSGGADANNRILVPFAVYQQVLGANDEISWLQAETVALAQADAAVNQIITVLTRRHQNRFDYKAETMAQYVDTAGRILGGVSVVGVTVKTVSLLVGGMGIMNIMSTSVLERTREIGLRKAVGACKSDILLQFLMEAVLISGIGGLLGLGVGVVVSYGLAMLSGFPVTPSWFAVIIAILVSVGVGLVSGYYPARRAAMMQPVVALRYE